MGAGDEDGMKGITNIVFNRQALIDEKLRNTKNHDYFIPFNIPIGTA